MNIKIRLILSLVVFCICFITILVTKEGINPHHNLYIQTIISSGILFLAIYSLTSLFNIKNKKHQKVYFIITGIFMIYPIVNTNYMIYSTVSRALYSGLVVSGIVAFVLRLFSLIREKYDSLPD